MRCAPVTRTFLEYVRRREFDRRRSALGKTRSTTLKSVSAKRIPIHSSSVVIFVPGDSSDDDDDDDESQAGQDGDASQH